MLGKLLSDLNLDRVYIANCIAIGILQSKSLLFSSKSPAFKTILQVLQELLVSFIQGGGGHGILGQAQGEGIGNSISVAGVGHVISNPQFKIPIPPPPC